jgi:hypothetical protein
LSAPRSAIIGTLHSKAVRPAECLLSAVKWTLFHAVKHVR